MDTNDIATLWAQDSPIDETNLVGESKRIPQRLVGDRFAFQG